MADLIARAASGDVEAQRELVQQTLSLAGTGTCAFADVLNTVELPARMAASHGVHGDRFVLASVLMYQAQVAQDSDKLDCYRAYTSEAANTLADLVADGSDAAATSLAVLLNSLADEGDDEAQRQLCQLSDLVSPEVMLRATAMGRDIAKQAEELAHGRD